MQLIENKVKVISRYTGIEHIKLHDKYPGGDQINRPDLLVINPEFGFVYLLEDGDDCRLVIGPIGYDFIDK